MRIGVIGYGWSGSSALVNFLEKSPDYYVYPGELSFMWDSGGVIDLYKYLTRDYSPYTISRKLLEFEELINVSSKKRNTFNPKGTGSAHLMKLKEVLFNRLNVEYVELSQRNIILSRSFVDYAFFKAKDLIKRRKYPWMNQLTKSDALQIFRESIDIYFQGLNPEKSLMIFDQPCYVDQVDVSVELLQLDYTYIFSREPSKILEDMVNHKSMFGVIKNVVNRKKVFNAAIEFLLSLETDGKARLISFEKFVNLQPSELQDLFPFIGTEALKDCIAQFDWKYSRSNA